LALTTCRSFAGRKRVCSFVSSRSQCTTSKNEIKRLEPHSADSLLAMGTRRIFNEEHDMFRDICRRFFNDKVVPFHEQWEQDGKVSRELWKQAGSTGLLGANTPTEFGGSGAGILSAAIVWEEQAYTGCTGPGFSLHSDIVIPYLVRYGTEEQKQRLIPGLVSGDLIGAIAMSEPGAGSDLAGVKTHAVLKDDEFILNGQKTFITNGQLADVVIVVCKTEPAKGAHGVSLLLVERDMKGFERGRNLKKMGLKAQDTSELFFDSVRVPKKNLLGEINKGFYMLMQELPQERLLIADIAVAAAEAMFEWTRMYTKERKAFGKTIADLQTTRHKMAELKTSLSVARAFIDQCLLLHSEGNLTTSTASMAKYWGSDLQNKVAYDCVQLHGGYGFMMEYPIARAFVDARVQPIYGGTNEIMKELIARTIYK